jgi:hypothetical protein
MDHVYDSGGMTKLTGQVAFISGKKWNDVMLYSFQLEGNDRWYRLGRKEPTFQTGDKIEFTERNSNVDSDSVTTSTSAAYGSPTVTEDGLKSPTNASAGPVGDRIRYQAARRDAANLVVAALHTDALPWASNVAKAKKLDLLTGYVQQVTRTLLEQEDSNGTK